MEDSGSMFKLPPVIGAFIAGMGVAYTLLFPAYLGSEKLDFEQARRDTAAWNKQKDDLLIEKAALETVLASTTKKLRQAEMATVFQFGNVYPMSLSDVRLGDPESAIEKAFPGVPITKDGDGHARVAVEHGAVRSIFYVLDGRPPAEKTVVRILFFMKAGDETALNDLFTATFGTPLEEKRAKIWNLPNGIQLRASGGHYAITSYATSSTKRAK